MSQNFIGPPKRDFDQLFRLAEFELITMRTDAVDAAQLVAMCVNASQGNPFFCCDPKYYRLAMNELIPLTGFNAKQFLEKVVPVSGFRKGQEPKFSFSKKNWANGDALAYRAKGTPVDGIIFACNWGLAQLPACRIVDAVESGYQMKYLQAYIADENMQMRELIRVYTQQLRMFGNCHKTILCEIHRDKRKAFPYQTMAERDLDLAHRLRHSADPVSAGYKV